MLSDGQYGLRARKAMAKEIARSAGLYNRLQRAHHDLGLSRARLQDLARELPESNALRYAIDDLAESMQHLEHCLAALDARG
jgi:hypothetical protein